MSLASISIGRPVHSLPIPSSARPMATSLSSLPPLASRYKELLISKISYPCTRIVLYELVDSRSFLGY